MQFYLKCSKLPDDLPVDLPVQSENNFEPLKKYSKVAAHSKKAVMTAATTNDLMRYDLRIQAALRGVVRTVLMDVARNGLPGDHHFFIAFRTTAPNVQMSDRLRREYPDEMNIVLQHQFWDLSVGEREFEVGLSFRNIPEKLLVPFDAITSFIDPHVQFALKFEVESANTETASPIADARPDGAKLREVPSAGTSSEKSREKAEGKLQDKQDKPAGQASVSPAKLLNKRDARTTDGKAGENKSANPDAGADDKDDTNGGDQTLGKVIALDAFRKKHD